jgi:hypothetical protein
VARKIRRGRASGYGLCLRAIRPLACVGETEPVRFSSYVLSDIPTGIEQRPQFFLLEKRYTPLFRTSTCSPESPQIFIHESPTAITHDPSVLPLFSIKWPHSSAKPCAQMCPRRLGQSANARNAVTYNRGLDLTRK